MAMTTTQHSLPRRRKRNQYSLASLFVVLTAAAVAFAVFRPAALVHLGVFLAFCGAFYAALFAVAIRLREKPLLSAVAWIAIRLAAIVPFAVAAFVIRGDEAFVVAMMSFFPDAPIWPAFSVVSWIREHLQLLFRGSGYGAFRDYWFWGVHYLATAVNLLIYLAWYGGGGYLAACWARRQSDRRQPGYAEHAQPDSGRP